MADSKKTTKTTAIKSKKVAVEAKSLEQLRADLVALQQEHIESRKSHRAGELVNPHVLTVQRKNIARLHTAISKERSSETKEEK
jgi:ribosomal protein L29